MGALYSTDGGDISKYSYVNTFHSSLKWRTRLHLPFIASLTACAAIKTHTHTDAAFQSFYMRAQRGISPRPAALQSCSSVSDGIICVLCCGPCEGGITYLFGEFSSRLYHLSPVVWPWDIYHSFIVE